MEQLIWPIKVICFLPSPRLYEPALFNAFIIHSWEKTADLMGCFFQLGQPYENKFTSGETRLVQSLTDDIVASCHKQQTLRCVTSLEKTILYRLVKNGLILYNPQIHHRAHKSRPLHPLQFRHSLPLRTSHSSLRWNHLHQNPCPKYPKLLN